MRKKRLLFRPSGKFRFSKPYAITHETKANAAKATGLVLKSRPTSAHSDDEDGRRVRRTRNYGFRVLSSSLPLLGMQPTHGDRASAGN